MKAKKLKKHLIIMAFSVLFMFGFCYAMVPFYNVMCKATGLNGKVDNSRALPGITKVDTSRTVTIELTSMLNQNLPGEFKSEHKKITLHPGEYVSTSYWVKNLTDKPMTVQAIPSVSPGIAATHIKKIECFCFTHQDLAPYQGMDMPLRFTIDPALPNSVKTLTLAYTLFDTTKN